MLVYIQRYLVSPKQTHSDSVNIELSRSILVVSSFFITVILALVFSGSSLEEEVQSSEVEKSSQAGEKAAAVGSEESEVEDEVSEIASVPTVSYIS